MYVKVVDPAPGGGQRLSLRCPACGQQGTFDPIPNISDVHVRGFWLGQRRCPNTSCNGHLFYIANDQVNVLRTYPPLRVDFDATNIPTKIADTLKQAVTCHAEECFVASAIMLRRCLEELCSERGASGATLKDRIGSLRSKVVLPQELFSALDELRLLGNDAAHVEAKTYDTIGKTEVEVAIELTKEILKAVYQLDSLVKRLQGLKKSP